MKKLPVSVIINTFNEEENLTYCLESIKWADEIIIVDMYSEDKTIEIAKKYTNKIFYFERCGYADPARQFALEKTRNEWCLLVDSDEIVQYSMYIKIKEILEKDLGDIVWFPRNNYVFGYLIKGNGFGALQNMQPRLFKKKYMSFTSSIHSFYMIKKDAVFYNIKFPNEGIIHFSYTDVEHFLEKLNRYTTIEAKNMIKGYKKSPKNILHEVYLIIKEYIKDFILLKGYKDGKLGLYLALLMVFYKISVYVKLLLIANYNCENPKEKIKEKYNLIAIKKLLEYKEKE